MNRNSLNDIDFILSQGGEDLSDVSERKENESIHNIPFYKQCSLSKRHSVFGQPDASPDSNLITIIVTMSLGVLN